MVLPKYVVTEWYGEGKSILSFKGEAPMSEENDDTETSAKNSGKITCYMSSLYVSEYEERVPSTSEVTDAEERTLSTLEVTDTDDAIAMPVTLNGDSLPVDDNIYTCPPDVSQEVWQSWLEHWENWKEIYIPLSWIQKNRSLCKDSHVEWHDTYIQDYPWVVPVIQDGLDESIHTFDCLSKEQDTAQKPEDTVNIDENPQEKGDSDKEPQEKVESDNESQEKAESHKKSQEEKSEKRSKKILVTDKKESQEKASNEDESEDKTGTEDRSHQSSDIEDVHHDLEAKKKLDKLYSEFSNVRYWVHLRSFLQNNGVQPSDSLIKIFAEQGQVDFCRASIKSDDSFQDFTIVSDYEINADKFKESARAENILEEESNGQELSVDNEVKHTNDSNEEDFTTISGSNLVPEELEKTGTKRRKGDREEVNLEENEAGKNSSLHSKRPRHERNHSDVNGHEKNCNATDDDEDSEEFEDCSLMKPLDGAKMKKSSKQKRKKKILSSPTSHTGLGWLMNYIGKKDRDRNSSGEKDKKDHVNTEINVDNIFSVEFCQGTQENALGQSNGLSSLGNLPSADYQFKADELNLKEDCRKLSKCFDSRVTDALTTSCNIKTDGSTMDKGYNDVSSDDDIVCEKEHNLTNKQSGENEIGEDCYEADEEEVSKDGESDHAAYDLKNSKATNKEGTTVLVPSKPWFLYPFSSLKNFLFMVASHVLSLFFPSVDSSRPLSSSLVFIRRLFGFAPKAKSSVKKKFKKPCQIRLEKWLQQACNKSVNLPKCEPFSRLHTYEDMREMPTLFQSLELVRQGDGTSFLTVNTLNLQDPLFSDHLNTDEDDWENCQVTFDKDGNPVSEPKSTDDREEGIWKEITANHKFVSYKNGKETPPADLPEDLHKYWVQRHRLFLRYDEGIKLDEESWYSVTPEMIAAHHAYRCKCDVVVDAFCGSGGNAIQLASTCNSVIAIDIDPAKIELARHNAAIYGVQDRIKFIVGDFFEVAPTLSADVVLLSPPWGGTEYLQERVYDVKSLGGVMKCEEVLQASRLITNNIALYLPRSSNLCQIIELAGLDGAVDLEYNYMNKKLKAVTAYFGDLVHY